MHRTFIAAFIILMKSISLEAAEQLVASRDGQFYIFGHASFHKQRFTLFNNTEGLLTWTPVRRDVERAKQILEQHLKTKVIRDADPDKKRQIALMLKNINRYRVQCFGFSENGERMLHLNFVRPAGRDDLFKDDISRKHIRVFDGGIGFWSTTVNFQNGTVVAFSINSSA